MTTYRMPERSHPITIAVGQNTNRLTEVVGTDAVSDVASPPAPLTLP
jgi:hypothetical protein